MSDGDRGGRPRWSHPDPASATGAVPLGTLAGAAPLPHVEKPAPADAAPPPDLPPRPEVAPSTEQAAAPPSEAEPGAPVQARTLPPELAAAVLAAELEDEPVPEPVAPPPAAGTPEPPLETSPLEAEPPPAAPPPEAQTPASRPLEGAPWPQGQPSPGVVAATIVSPTAARAASEAPSRPPPPELPAPPRAEDPAPIQPEPIPSEPVRPSLEKRSQAESFPPVRAAVDPAPAPIDEDPYPASEGLRLQPRLAGVDPRVAPREPGSRRGLLIGAGAVAALLAAVALASVLLNRDDERPSASTRADAPAEASADAPAEAYAPPDREAVRDAYAEVGRLYRTAGVSGLAEAARRCFADLAERPSYRGLDYCSAVDAFGAAFAHRAAGAPAPSDSWFGQAETRYLQTAEAVLGPERDAAARLVDIRRLAIEVARESGPAFAAASQPAAPEGSVQVEPVEPVEAPQPAPSRPPSASPPVQATPSRPAPAPVRRADVAPAPPRAAAPPAPARRPGEVDREAYVAARIPEAGPTAAEVAAARPRAGRGPSFNCRYARSTSERIVCGDPEIAALDRRLNAAFEDAIASGVDRRTLRREQDRWLGEREAAAPDPDAVADVYRRRIDELDSMR